MKSYRKLLIVLSMLMICPIVYAGNTQSAALTHSYHVHPESYNSCNYTFGNGEERTYLRYGVPNTLLMIDGAYVIDTNIHIADNRSFIPVRKMNDILGFATSWEESNKSITMELGDQRVTLELEDYQEQIKNINNEVYVSMRLLEEKLGLNVNYYPVNSQVFYNGFSSIITVDNPNTEICIKSVEEAYDAAYMHLKYGLDEFSKNPSELVQGSEQLDMIDNYINEMKYVTKSSRFYLFQGPYQIMVDEITGKIYVQGPHGVREFDPNDPWVYAQGFYVG